MPVYTIICLHCVITYSTSCNSTLGWITLAIQILQAKSTACLKSLAVSGIKAGMFDNCIIKTIPSDAKLCEKQDGGKQHFLGQTTADLEAVFYLDVAENIENQRFKCKKTTFLASFHD